MKYTEKDILEISEQLFIQTNLADRIKEIAPGNPVTTTISPIIGGKTYIVEFTISKTNSAKGYEINGKIKDQNV